MVDAAPVWDRIVERHDLAKYPVDTLASWWHSDLDLGRTIETFTEHDEEPAARIHRLPAHRSVIPRPLRSVAQGAHHPRSIRANG